MKVMVIRYRGISPKLGTSQGECPYPCTQVSFFGEEDDDGCGDEVAILSPGFKSWFLLKNLILKILDVALQKIDLLIEVEDDVLHRLAIHLVITGEFHDHGVIGTESTLHHPLAPEDLLLHRLKPGLHSSYLLGPLNIPDVEQPLTHLNGLRVL
mgnify:CR=1 FL=1